MPIMMAALRICLVVFSSVLVKMANWQFGSFLLWVVSCELCVSIRLRGQGMVEVRASSRNNAYVSSSCTNFNILFHFHSQNPSLEKTSITPYQLISGKSRVISHLYFLISLILNKFDVVKLNRTYLMALFLLLCHLLYY